MEQRDYYEILGIDGNVAAKEIKEAYRRLAFQYHPDKNPGDAAAVERMKGINEAYAVLSDRVKRERYDSLRRSYGDGAYDRFRQGYSDNDIFRDSDINQIFEDLSRSFGFRHFEDVFREVYGPGYRTFEFRQGNVFGRGFVFTGRMRPGTSSIGSALGGIVSGILGKLTGYALKKIIGIGSPREGDRYDILKLTPEQAKKGCKIGYTDKKYSRDIVIAVPPGVTQGKVIRLRALGPGDLYLKVDIAQPLLQKIARRLLGR